MINEKTDLHSSPEDSDILVDDNFIQDDNTFLENSGEQNQRKCKYDVYSQPGNSTNDLKNRMALEPPSAKKDQLAVNMTTNRNIIEFRDQLTMRKDNYVYFISMKGEPRDKGSKILQKGNELTQFLKSIHRTNTSISKRITRSFPISNRIWSKGKSK